MTSMEAEADPKLDTIIAYDAPPKEVVVDIEAGVGRNIMKLPEAVGDPGAFLGWTNSVTWRPATGGGKLSMTNRIRILSPSAWGSSRTSI